MLDTAPPQPRRSSPGGSSRGLWVLVLVLLAPAVALPLVVPLYDSTDPTLNGWPFYYWFQMAMIIMSGVLTIAAYFVALRAARESRGADREVRR